MSEVGAYGAALVLTLGPDPGSWSLPPPPPAGRHRLGLERFGCRSQVVGTSACLGPTPHPGLGGSGPKAGPDFPAVPRRPALQQAQLGGLNRRPTGTGLSLSTASFPPTRRETQASARRVHVHGSALSALNPTRLPRPGEGASSKADEPQVAKSQRVHSEELTPARVLSHFPQFSNFLTASPRVHPVPRLTWKERRTDVQAERGWGRWTNETKRLPHGSLILVTCGSPTSCQAQHAAGVWS